MIAFEKALAQVLFWIYDFIDTIGSIFNILTGTQKADGTRTLLEVFVESAVSTKVLIGLCLITVVIAGACMAVKIFKNIIQLKSGGEPVSNAVTIKQGFFAVLSSVVCIFFVFLFISFAAMLLNMVNSVIAPAENLTLSQNLFNLSVQQSYVIDESKIEYRYTDYLDEYGNTVQKTDENGNPVYKTDENGNLITDESGKPIADLVQIQEAYHPYLRDEEGNLVMETGWVDSWTAADISWSMKPNEVFGIHKKDALGLFEQGDKGYEQQPMVRLEAFNLFTAYLVAIVILISMFMLSVGLVKRIYDIIVLIICMPLVCGTIPLDDGARFRAWRETFMSKVLVAFGAVIALNVFYMISGFITGSAFGTVFDYLINEQILSDTAVTVFRMFLLLGGALCINGSQTLIARILGTSADESREAMQSLAMITSGVRLGAVGALGAGRVAMGAGRAVFGGTNRYGRQRTGLVPMMFRGGNAIGERIGGANYANSRGGAFVRTLGRMGGRYGGYANGAASSYQNGNEGSARLGSMGGLENPMHNVSNGQSNSSVFQRSGGPQPTAIAPIPRSTLGNGGESGSLQQPSIINNAGASVGVEKINGSSVKPTNGLRSSGGKQKTGAYNDSKHNKR